MKKIIACAVPLLFMLCAPAKVSAQGFLKKMLNTSTSEVNASKSILKINYESIPTYTIKEVRYGTKNADGTENVSYFLVDQNGNIRTAEAVNAQHKQLGMAVRAILAKVGLGAAIGGVTEGLDGAAVGAVSGAVASIGDISQARKLKKSLAAQKKLIADYEKNFTKEGKPVSAQVDVSKIKGIDAEPMVIDPAKVSELLSKADDASTDAFLSE